MATVAQAVKRILVGRPLSSAKLEHQLFPKLLALPVFSSDPLSSVAYATEEMMLILVLAGAGALSLMMPIGIAIAGVLLIVVTSYRQTVRAYPQGGGSYIVARENLGTFPGLTAASAILIGYVVTASVSATAGAVAVISAFPELAEHRITLAIVFIAIVAIANLRGAREAGMLFAVPTYGFVASVYATLLFGLFRCLGGCPAADTANLPLPEEAAIGPFLILLAFTSGSSALTGVEAVADGVQAFRRPRSRNAATTLGIMAAMSATMFLGVTFLAQVIDVRVTHEVAASRSVLAQVGETIFGRTPMFFVLQLFTAMILIVAANTAYQDFPRLSAILARDRFMPRQFGNRGNRLVFSNGILVLAVSSALLVWVFQGSLTNLIALYLVAVFTAFTLSQAGMVRRWIRVRGESWRRNAIINGIGATTTGLVLIVVMLTKFLVGAWIAVLAIPIMIAGLLAVHRHYTATHAQLRARRLSVAMEASNTFVLLVSDLDLATRDAVSWLRAVRPERVLPLYVGKAPLAEVQAAWEAMAPRLGTLQQLEGGSGRRIRRPLVRYLRGLGRDPDEYLTVVVPETVNARTLLSYLRRGSIFMVKAGLLFERGVVVVDIPLLPAEREEVAAWKGPPLEFRRHVCLVPLSALHDATVRALVYAKSLTASRLEALHFASEAEEADELMREWRERGVDVPLTIAEMPFRDLRAPLLREVRRHTSRGDTVVTVVLPEFVVKRWWHHLLHNQTALFVKRLLLFEPRVVVVSVPVHLD
ncbi:MAG: APC family permease [Actinomycetota bacterium]|nr:APC family permease [Actinomycetota bacterium]